jgi:outer membrane protein OmpA-like peptidoglycan-associated protein
MPVMIKSIHATGGTIDFADETINPAVKTSFQSLAVMANDLSLLPDFATGDIAVEGQLGNGSVRLAGDIDANPVHGHFLVTGKSLPFEPFRGYLDQLFRSAKSSGDFVDGRLKLVFVPGDQGEIVTSVTGNIAGQNMSLRFSEAESPFLATARLGIDLRAVRLGSNPRVDIDRIAFTRASLRVLRNQAGQLNLSRLWARPEAREPENDQEQKTSTATTVAIRSITVDQSKIEVRDRSVSPDYTTNVAAVGGKLVNIVPTAKRAEIDLTGRFGDDAQLSLSGWFTPFTEKPYVQLHGTIRGYALPPLNPYATQYISHRIRQGQVTTEINYTLKGDELQATAGLVLRNLQVGERTGDEFAQRIGIPLELAVALLQDINGIIRLQLAMNSDRRAELNIASLVWTAVRNAIVRAITAPFRLVGNILTFGGRIGEIRIQPVPFRPGTDELQPESKNQLEQLATLLKNKPKLELKLNGSVAASEVDALKKKRFWEKIQKAQGKNYQEALIAVYRDLGGITRPVTPLAPTAEESLEKFVMEQINVGGDELTKLAKERAAIVERELQERGIDPQRLSATAADSPARSETPAVQIEIVS